MIWFWWNRMMPPDRTYAKEILNSIGASQSVTDRERAQIALSYHCLSLLDDRQHFLNQLLHEET